MRQEAVAAAREPEQPGSRSVGLEGSVLPRTILCVLLVLIAGVGGACVPASWGAAAILHPARRTALSDPPRPHEEVTFKGHGVLLRGWRFPAAGARRGSLIYLHGVADNRGSVAGIAARYVPRGFDVVAYDSRAHGRSEGDACTYGFYEKQDLSRVLDVMPAGPWRCSASRSVRLWRCRQPLRTTGSTLWSRLRRLRTSGPSSRNGRPSLSRTVRSVERSRWRNSRRTSASRMSAR